MHASPLRPYQERAVASVRSAYSHGARRILLVLPTGSGKTTVGVAVIESALAKGRRAVWLTHRRELVSQASARLVAQGVEHGIITADSKTRQNPTAPVQVCSIQTLVARPDAIPPGDIIIPDEAHHDTCDTWQTVRDAFPAPELVLGLTATPERGDGTAMGNVYDEMVVGSTIKELTELGWLLPADVIAPAKFQSELCGDPVEMLAKHAAGRRAIVFAANVREAQRLARVLPRAACIDGKTAKATRQNSLERFAAGDIDVLVNVFVLTEGFDCPGAEVAMIARGCSNAGMYLQICGRVLRPAEGRARPGERALILDLCGSVHKHGLPDEARQYSLEGRAISRGDEKPMALRQCRQCGCIFKPAPRCIRCGAMMPPAPLPRVKHAEAELMTADRVTPESTKKAYFDSLCATACVRGWKRTAVGVRFKMKYGHWPRWQVRLTL